MPSMGSGHGTGSHRSHSTKHTLPDNPVFIDFTRSDGDSALWPTNTTRVVDEEGCVNFMQPVGLDEPLAIKWRVGVGDAMSSQLSNYDKKRPHVLRGWPAGYRMFDHHKGKAESPRHDVYLFGSDSRCRFRSVPEFIPHAMWLMGDPNDTCKCKYCTKKPQREITTSLGLRQSHSPSPTRPLSRPKTERVTKKISRLGDRLNAKSVFAAVQKTEPTVLHPSPHVQTKHIMLVERSNHLREAVRPPQSGGLPRWFRDGELVWVSLPTEIIGDNGISIQYWPAVIEESRIAKETKPIVSEGIVGEENLTPWVTREYTTYKVMFLAIMKIYSVQDVTVLPYQSHAAMRDILEVLANRPPKDWADFTAEKRAAFDPCHLPPPSFAEALTPLATALQIASNFSTHWCLTDEWDARLSVPPAVPRLAPPPSSLQSAIESAGNHNAHFGSISSGPISKPSLVTQTRFQGMWWGGERIWADDFVRLKIPRSCLAPAGVPHIFAPSGPGPKSKALIASSAEHYGAMSRGVFMKIQNIFLVDGTGKRECRVAGQLYEVADADWEDPNLPRDTVPPATTNSVSSTSVAKHSELPHPPTGYKFRSILAPDHEAVLSLSLISGRYYPRILQHPLNRPHVNDIIPSQESLQEAAHLWALEGLVGGYKNAIDPQRYKSNREKMMTDAVDDAMRDLQEHIENRKARAAEEMDVDD